MLISSSFNGGTNSTTVSYTNGGLESGPIMVWNSAANLEPQIIPLNNSTINNEVRLGIGPKPGQEGNAIVNVGAGITANWNGQLTGFSPLTKIGTGQLVLGNAANTHTGAIAVNAGTLKVNGMLPSSGITVASGAILGGNGNATGNVNILTGGTVSPGNSIDVFTTGNVSIAGALLDEIDMNGGVGGSADLLSVAGTVGLTNATLNLNLSNVAGTGTYIVVANDGADPVSGTFGTITGLSTDYSATINYAFSGTDSVGRIGDGNDIAVNVVPEPSAFALAMTGGLLAMKRRRRIPA
jgi:autotransporter-associated beta strand protein